MRKFFIATKVFTMSLKNMTQSKAKNLVEHYFLSLERGIIPNQAKT
jgi:hypothetical protein